MNMKRFRAVFIIVAIMAVFALPISAAPKTTITFWTDAGGDFLPFFKDYTTKHADIDLQISVYQTEDYKTQSRLALSSGTGPDVWTTNNGSFHDQFIDGGGAMDMTAAAQKYGWAARIDANSLATCVRDGKLYGLPWGGFYPWQVLFANKDFFKSSGLAYPKTVDDLVALAKQIRAKGMQPVAFGNKDLWPGQIIFGDYILQLKDPSIVKDLNTGKMKWTDSKEAATVFDTLAKLAKGQVFVDGYQTQDHEAAIQAWIGKKAAFLYNGTWFYGGHKDIPFEVETIPLPLVNASTVLKGVQLFPDPVIFVNAKSKVQNAALDFLDYVTSVPYYQLLAKQNACFTPSPEANKTVALPGWLKAEPLLKQTSFPQSNYWTVTFPVPVEEAFGRQIQAIMAGQATTAQALQAVEDVHAKNR